MVSDISVLFQFSHSFTQVSCYLLSSPNTLNMPQNTETSSKLNMHGLIGISSLERPLLSSLIPAKFNCFLSIQSWWTLMKRESKKSFQDLSLSMSYSTSPLLWLAISQPTARLLRSFLTEALSQEGETMLLWLPSFQLFWYCSLQSLSTITLSGIRYSTCSSKRKHSHKKSKWHWELIWFRNIVCTFSFIAFTCFLAIVYPNVSDVLGILGGLNATAIQFLVPSKNKWANKFV